MKSFQRNLMFFIMFFTGLTWLLPAQANPAFVRQTDKKCSYCHTAWPQLTVKGRQFKEQGYRLPNQVNKDISLSELLETFPIGGKIVSNVVKAKDNDTEFHALDEIELFLSGSVAKKISFWTEIEGEGADGFNSQVGTGNMAYHYNRYLNVRAGYANIFWDDPYGLLSDHFRLSIRPTVINQNFGGAEGVEGQLRQPRQMISAYGRAFNNRLFYDIVYAGNTKDVLGADPRVIMGRLAYDITDDMHIGGFYIDGSKGSSTTGATLGIVAGVPGVIPAIFTPSADFQRYGFDAHVDYKNFRLLGAYIHADDDLNDGAGNQGNDAFSIEAFYTFKNKSGSPTWVPVLVYNDYETTNGTQDFGEGAVQLNYYVTENVKVFGQYFRQLDTPAGVPENDSWTLQFEVAF